MREESTLIPYSASRLEGSPLVVLAPHPDDEVFGCGGVLAQAVASGAEIHVVILTDGAAQGDVEIRRAEALEAARRLGLPEPQLWGLPDRSLQPDDRALRARLEALLLEVRPHAVLVPSTAEIHPDHRALAIAVYQLLQEIPPGSELHEAVRSLRLISYEVSAVLRPNLLVDVTAEWAQVRHAAEAYSSQIEHIPYLVVLEGVATARRLTLPSAVSHAEAYYAVDMRYVRTHATSEWAAAQGPSAVLEDSAGAAEIDVVVRTRNRPHLLRDALESVRAQVHAPSRLIVVNDGGVSVAEVCAASGLAIDLVEYGESRGRSAAAQIGLERCAASHAVFLDDDDLLLPEHLMVLGQAVARGVTVPYTDAVQGLWTTNRNGVLAAGRTPPDLRWWLQPRSAAAHQPHSAADGCPAPRARPRGGWLRPRAGPLRGLGPAAATRRANAVRASAQGDLRVPGDPGGGQHHGRQPARLTRPARGPRDALATPRRPRATRCVSVGR